MSLTVPRFARNFLDSVDDDFRSLDSYRPFRRSTTLFRDSDVGSPKISGDKFTLRLDFDNFDPSDISVKVEDDMLVIKGKRERKRDGAVESREYVQKFNVPKNVQAEFMTCNLDRTGYLNIEAPVKVETYETKHDRYSYGDRYIPVQVVRRSALNHY